MTITTLIPAGNQSNIYSMELQDGDLINGTFDKRGAFRTAIGTFIHLYNGRWLHIENEGLCEKAFFLATKIKQINEFRAFSASLQFRSIRRK